MRNDDSAGGPRDRSGRSGRSPSASGRSARDGRTAGGRPSRPSRPARPPARDQRPSTVEGRASTPDTEEDQGPQRLQKVLAAAGIGSRRACEELIVAGRVTVDGRRAELGQRVDPRTAEIYVDGERVVTDTRLVYLMVNKPRGFVTTMSDEKGRPGITELLGPYVPARVYHVGRLDADSEGLLLLTNDGSLAHRLTHPSYGVSKTYLAEVPGPLAKGVGRALKEGVQLDDGVARADSFRLVDQSPRTALVEIVLHEGRKHIVRRMLDAVGHPVLRLVRLQVGPIALGDLKSGRWRHLTRTEVAALFAAVAAEEGIAADDEEEPPIIRDASPDSD